MFPLYVSPETIKNFRRGLFISLLYLLLICFSRAQASGNAFNSRKKLMNKKILPRETAAKISGSFSLDKRRF